MKKLLVLCVMNILLLSACGTANNISAKPIDQKSTEAPTAERPAKKIITFEMAPSQDGVEEFLADFDHSAGKYQDNPCFNITPAEITEKYGFQIFKFANNAEGHLLYKGRHYDLGAPNGSWGIETFAVADLNEDQIPELYFSYSWGSGVDGYRLTCFEPASGEFIHLYVTLMGSANRMTFVANEGRLEVYRARPVKSEQDGALVYTDLHFKAMEDTPRGEIVFEDGVFSFKERG